MLWLCSNYYRQFIFIYKINLLSLCTKLLYYAEGNNQT